MSYATKEQLAELAAYMASQINVPTIGIGGGYAPIGTIISYMGTTAPQDYLACDGSTKNIADYPQLADFFEAQFGSKNYFGGDGVTTFAVPDLQGEFLRGTGTNGHTNQGSGANVGVHQDGTKHVNTTWYAKRPYCASTSDGTVEVIDQEARLDNTSGFSQVRAENCTFSTAPDYFAHYTSRPTNTSVLYCIKAVVAGDVYSTEERVVGTWIDGKKIYQKTIDCGALPKTGIKQIDLQIQNLKAILDIRGIAIGGSTPSAESYMFPMNWLNVNDSTNSSLITVYYAGTTTKKLVIGVGQDRSSLGVSYVTIQYTKTTD